MNYFCFSINKKKKERKKNYYKCATIKIENEAIDLITFQQQVKNCLLSLFNFINRNKKKDNNF